VIAGNDRAIPPQLEKDEATAIKATSITLQGTLRLSPRLIIAYRHGYSVAV
jgi:hypothetical protein